MSDNEYLRFEITDYDLQNEFNPNRNRRRPTRNQQIYGIWADDDSENEVDTELTGRRNRRGRGSGNTVKDYSAPVSFVAGGIQQAGKKDKTEKQEEDDSQITDEDEEQPRFGQKQLNQSADNDNTSSESEEEQPTARHSGRAGFGAGTSYPSSSAGGATNKLASWEQHTKGIGAKLLLQMGYEPGKGLGKTLQGISQPVQAHVRKGRGAIGAYGPEKKTTVGGQKVQPAIDEDVREAKEFKEKLNQWKKDEKEDKKTRYYYRSVQEVIEKGKKTPSILTDKFRYNRKHSNKNKLKHNSDIYFISNKLSNVTVIDMTGPEKRVLSGYHALGQAKVIDEELYEHRQAKKCKNFVLPELMHNLNLIVDMCEQEIISIDKNERDANDRQKQLEHDKENLEKIVKLEEDHLNTLQKALILVENLTNPNSESSPLTLERAEKIFIELQTDFAGEYKEFGLGDLAAGVVAPLVNNELRNWKPLDEPTNYVEKIKKWKTVLGMHQSETRNVFDPYSSLIWSGVMPKLRLCSSEWNPKNHQQMAALLDTWAPVLPTWILDNVLEQLILPRLSAAVQEWDPLTDTIPIHIWILPWSGILGHKMEEFIYPTIRDKLGNALQEWIPQDRSARAMLTPWKQAFPDGEMQSFLLQNIIPKLQIVLNEYIINPLQQDLEMWNQVWEWHELISTILMSQLLDKYFFPKWMQTLVLWLNQSPNLEQISRWYTGWKSLISDDVLQQTNIKEHFRRALELMHRATGAQPMDIQPQPVPQPQMTTSSSTGVSTIGPPPALMDLQIPPPPQLEFKELVSQKCAERGIIFAPMPGRREFGKQVYRIGKLFCYIDRAVLMMSDGSFTNWSPISLSVLLDRAVTG